MAMRNSDMKPGRIKRWADARKKLAFIRDNVNAGRTVYLTSYTKVTKITANSLVLVTAEKTGLYVQHGSKKVCYDYAGITCG